MSLVRRKRVVPMLIIVASDSTKIVVCRSQCRLILPTRRLESILERNTRIPPRKTRRKTIPEPPRQQPRGAKDRHGTARHGMEGSSADDNHRNSWRLSSRRRVGNVRKSPCLLPVLARLRSVSPLPTFHIPTSSFQISHSKFYIPNSIFQIPHSKFHIPNSTFFSCFFDRRVQEVC